MENNIGDLKKMQEAYDEAKAEVASIHGVLGNEALKNGALQVGKSPYNGTAEIHAISDFILGSATEARGKYVDKTKENMELAKQKLDRNSRSLGLGVKQYIPSLAQAVEGKWAHSIEGQAVKTNLSKQKETEEHIRNEERTKYQ